MKKYKILIQKERIMKRVKELAKEIVRDNKKEIFIICVLKGATIFHADLIREIAFLDGPKIYSDYIRASSYSGMNSKGGVNLLTEINVEGKDVIIVEDIIDTGRTLKKIKSRFRKEGASSVKICALLDKPSGRINNIKGDYIGFVVQNKFVVGYGLDYNEKFRELPFIAEIKKT